MEQADEKRPQFGNRRLTSSNDVFEHNAWDDVDLGEAHVKLAEAAIAEQKKHPVAEQAHLHERASEFWDSFYSCHDNKFFKDRQWLFTEFPEILALSPHSTTDVSVAVAPVPDPSKQYTKDGFMHVVLPDDLTIRTRFGGRCFREAKAGLKLAPGMAAKALSRGIQQVLSTPAGRWTTSKNAKYRLLEVGCGAGNTIRPILERCPDPELFIYGCDYAASAIDVVRATSWYSPSRCHAFRLDIAHEAVGLPENSLDVILLIFVLSALQPSEMASAIAKLVKCLKPGGLLLFRDYGRHDLAQLRFKHDRYLADNFYVRGDGTRVYFYTQDEVRELMSQHGLVEEQNYCDKRLIVNRKTRQEMQRYRDELDGCEEVVEMSWIGVKWCLDGCEEMVGTDCVLLGSGYGFNASIGSQRKVSIQSEIML
eukprot:m.50652 g.50652  ORF g.50652 m.50652 type:complete len:423 (+) comp13445_c0_seq2:86-1354(+)